MRTEERLKVLAERELRKLRPVPGGDDGEETFSERFIRLLPALIAVGLMAIASRGWSWQTVRRILFGGD